MATCESLFTRGVLSVGGSLFYENSISWYNYSINKNVMEFSNSFGAFCSKCRICLGYLKIQQNILFMLQWYQEIHVLSFVEF